MAWLFAKPTPSKYPHNKKGKTLHQPAYTFFAKLNLPPALSPNSPRWWSLQ
jgi:hypothetical protein